MKTINPCRPKWKGILSDRERFYNQMHYKPFDRTFNMEFGYWDENFKLWPIFANNDITNNDEADIFFNFDRYKTVSGVHWINPSFERRIVERRGDRNVLINEDGLFAEVPIDGHDTIPHYIRSSIKTPDDWKKIKAERFRLDDPARRLDIDAYKKLYTEHDYPLGIDVGSMIGKVRDMLTFEGLAYAVFDYPEMVEDMVETCCQLVELSLDQLLPALTFDYAAGWEDICYKGGPIVSVKFFKNIVMPRYKRIHAKLQKAGIDIWWIDCDGDVRPILPYMMEGGVNCLFPYEVNSCTHPAKLLEEYGKDLRIMGGVDKLELGKGREAIKAYMDTIAPLIERGGYIPFCDHRCPPNVPPDDYIFYLDLKEQMFGLK